MPVLGLGVSLEVGRKVFPRIDLLSVVLASPIATGCNRLSASPNMSCGTGSTTGPFPKAECSRHGAGARDIHNDPKAAPTHRGHKSVWVWNGVGER